MYNFEFAPNGLKASKNIIVLEKFSVLNISLFNYLDTTLLLYALYKCIHTYAHQC